MGFVQDGIEKLYTQFILHDIFGKMVPGSIVLFSFAYAISGDLEVFIKGVQHISFYIWLAGLGISWQIGFVLQAMREDMKLVNPNDPNAKSKYETRIRFYEKATPYEQQQLNRFWLVHDGAANGSSSFLVAAIIFFVISIISILTNIIEIKWIPWKGNSGFIILGIILGLVCLLFWQPLRKIANAYKNKHEVFLKVSEEMRKESIKKT